MGLLGLLFLCALAANPAAPRSIGDEVEEKIDAFLANLYGDIFLEGAGPHWEPRHAEHTGHENALHYTNEWLVHVPGGSDKAKSVAQEMNYQFVGQVSGFRDVYLLLKNDSPQVHKRGARELTYKLESHEQVSWADQQYAKDREKRDFHLGGFNLGRFLEEYHLSNTLHPPPLDNAKRFNDELWDKEWYMFDTRTKSNLPRLDLNILPVFDLGYTGKGVKVVILDDGLEYRHEDLISNYNPEISGDLNDNDNDPTPRYGGKPVNSHGTRCAGEIAMKANNTKCGVGIAYDSQIGGVRMLDGPVSDRVEGESLTFALKKVDIYSASWGPNDDGQTVEGPGRLAQRAFIKAATTGRNGKGAIHVWASGNGGAHDDSCSCDGYASSIYTLSIGSASESGTFPWYGEKCPSTMAVTYSSGAYTDQKIATTDLENGCTTSHTGTSASAPMAAGIIALALQANPSLTWRDVQHVVAWSAQPYPLKDNEGWQKNAAGFHFNSRFGFGLMDALGMVQLAKNWTNVPPQRLCRIKAVPLTDKLIHPSDLKTASFISDACKGTPNEINYLEHIEVVTTIQYSNRGSLNIQLMSPQGTKTILLFPRKNDISSTGFSSWPFMSVHTWGENPSGEWILSIRDITGDKSNRGYLNSDDLILNLYGTGPSPLKLSSGPRVYNELYKKSAVA